MEGAGCPIDIRFAPTRVEKETEFMTLLMRDKENKKLGKYEMTVSVVRGLYGEIPDELIINKSKISQDLFDAILDCIAHHPDWDDEDVADWLIQEYE
ncbi:MAG: hypothetical protein J5819_00545 [Eubacterium sp.]|nr:hypothetical protein [Eubacterium sp.]